ncbi:MAG TPA: carboxypeptidase-like regulatory domain-containing protein [Bacteroidota bacterium]|nr:carboxypeptidase-like regulatory domain-containing protein [Bacteroidota bacterium]
MRPSSRILLSSLVCCVVLSSLTAQRIKPQVENIVAGTIIDAETKQGIGDVSILIHGTYRGTSTDGGGYFEFKNLPEDVYLLEIRHVAYRPRVYALTVRRDDQRMVVIEMRPRVIQMPEVLVEGASELPGTFNEINAYKIVRLEDIQKSGAPNMREVLTQHAPFASYAYTTSTLSPLNRPPMLYLNGILTESWVLDMIDVTTIEKVLVWRASDAPIAYRGSTSRYIIDVRTKEK